MGIFSEELKILDRNTVQLMIDDMQDTINSQKTTIDFQKNVISEKDVEIVIKLEVNMTRAYFIY